jgi:hypothetical protein
MITLVPFYKDINLSNEGIELNQMNKIFDYKKALYLMKNTFEKFNKNYKFEIQTDNYTRLEFPNIFRSNLDNMNIMESVVVSNANYVQNNHGKMILVGADHLICSDVKNFFNDDFDIGIFVNGCNVNNTVVLVDKNETNQKYVNEFFVERTNVYNNLDLDTKLWYGDQYSLSCMLNKHDIIKKYLDKKTKNIFQYNNLKVKLFDYGYLVKGVKKGGDLKHNKTNILIDFKGVKRKEHFEKIYNKIMEYD